MTSQPLATTGSGNITYIGYEFAPSPGTLANSTTPQGSGDVWDAIDVDTQSPIPNELPNSVNGPNYAGTVVTGPYNNCLQFNLLHAKGLFPGVPLNVATYRLVVFDFCDINNINGRLEAGFEINSNSLSKYVRTFSNGSGKPEVIVQTSLNSDGSRDALIYNDLTGQYENFYTTAAHVARNNGLGSDYFVVSYADYGSCPTVGSEGESGFRYNNLTGPDSGFTEIQFLGPSNFQSVGQGPCQRGAGVASPTIYGVYNYPYNDTGFYVSNG